MKIMLGFAILAMTLAGGATALGLNNKLPFAQCEILECD